MSDLSPQALEVLQFWFLEIEPELWFSGSAALDAAVTERFSKLLALARRGDLDQWANTPRGRLALVILLDQFSRHVFRNQAEAFDSDRKAQALTIEAIEQGADQRLNSAERHFLYMPLMHAEDPQIQSLSVAQFKSLRAYAEDILGYAQRHASTIQRFGRFPARNAALGRKSTEVELESISKSK